jgi:hypothetical protein
VYCRKRTDDAADEQVRALWIAMAQMQTKLAEEVDQMPQETGIADDRPTISPNHALRPMRHSALDAARP